MCQLVSRRTTVCLELQGLKGLSAESQVGLKITRVKWDDSVARGFYQRILEFLEILDIILSFPAIENNPGLNTPLQYGRDSAGPQAAAAWNLKLGPKSFFKF